MASPFDLRAASHQAMLENGFVPDVPPDVQAQVSTATDPSHFALNGAQDLRALPWSSIDNDDSKDLDQLEVVESLSNDNVRVRVAIADVDATVTQGSVTDQFAGKNATSVYTGVVTYPMLPAHLSTDLTSLGKDADRPSVIIEFVVASDGTTSDHTVYLARVTNKAKLAYSNVGAWLEGRGTLPDCATAEIQEQLRLQDRVAQRLRSQRDRVGALEFQTIEAESVVNPDGSVAVQLALKTRASQLIEAFMVAANVTMATFLDAHNSPTIRRIVRTPERWPRIVALAAKFGTTLPEQADAPALSAFLAARRQADPTHFPDLSLSIVKLLGPGEYALHTPGSADEGHFALAAHDYTHSTAPNRRYADLVTQRLLKAVLAGKPASYSNEELATIAQHCTEREDAARKVERLVRKMVAAVSMQGHVGDTFDAIVTGVNQNGTFVRVLNPPIEGRVMRGEEGMDVGDKVKVTLLSTDPARGFIDFAGTSK